MSTGAWVGVVIGVGIFLLLLGAFLGFYISKKMFEKQIKENPPITEKQVRAMFMSMGRKPSESQIKAVMRSIQNSKNK